MQGRGNCVCVCVHNIHVSMYKCNIKRHLRLFHGTEIFKQFKCFSLAPISKVLHPAPLCRSTQLKDWEWGRAAWQL